MDDTSVKVWNSEFSSFCFFKKNMNENVRHLHPLLYIFL